MITSVSSRATRPRRAAVYDPASEATKRALQARNGSCEKPEWHHRHLSRTARMSGQANECRSGRSTLDRFTESKPRKRTLPVARRRPGSIEVMHEQPAVVAQRRPLAHRSQCLAAECLALLGLAPIASLRIMGRRPTSCSPRLVVTALLNETCPLRPLKMTLRMC